MQVESFSRTGEALILDVGVHGAKLRSACNRFRVHIELG